MSAPTFLDELEQRPRAQGSEYVHLTTDEVILIESIVGIRMSSFCWQLKNTWCIPPSDLHNLIGLAREKLNANVTKRLTT